MEIELKNILKLIDHRLTFIEFYKQLWIKAYGIDKIEMQNNIRVNKIDYDEFKEQFIYIKKKLDEDELIEYDIIFWKKLNYVVPVAFQGQLKLHGDLKGNTINDIYNFDSSYKIEYLNLCIFPLEKESIILLYQRKENIRYDKFINQFKELGEEEKLQLITFIIIMYCEDYFINPNLEEEIKKNKTIKECSNYLEEIPIDFENQFMKDFEIKRQLNLLKNYVNIPNILSEKYSVKK